jgi:hypothetical protein
MSADTNQCEYSPVYENNHPPYQLLHPIKAPHHPWPEIAARNIGATLSGFLKPDRVKYIKIISPQRRKGAKKKVISH